MILKIRGKSSITDRPETVYIPTWGIIEVLAKPDYVFITYGAIDSYEEGGSYSRYVTIKLDFNDKIKDDKDKLKVAEAFAEEIIAMIKDRSVRIVDVDEIKKKYEVVMK